jgi:hypothetical protein
MDRITAIRSSLAVFVCGIVGLIPVVGFLPALYALIVRGRVRARYREWNPAARYLNLGAALGGLGLTYSAVGLVILVYQVAG